MTHPLQVIMNYDSLSHFVGEEVYLVHGECSWMNFSKGTIRRRRGTYYLGRETANGPVYCKIKRQSDCNHCPWLGDGIWFEGIFLGQVI